MMNHDWIDNTTVLQVLLDATAQIGNAVHRHNIQGEVLSELEFTKDMLVRQIECLRDPIPPVCYGEDDCSTAILSKCPWRMTCGSK